MPFAAFLMETHPEAVPLMEEIAHGHVRDRTDAGEGVGHERNQRPVAQPGRGGDIDGIQKLGGLGAGQTGVLPRVALYLGPRTLTAGLEGMMPPVAK